MSTKTVMPGIRAKRSLIKTYEGGGYMRIPNDTRREEAPTSYKKGYEIRLVADTRREITAIRRLLRTAGLKGGKPFRKHSQWVQPIYGRESMDRFCSWLDELG